MTNKYGAKACYADNIRFDSLSEMRRYLELKLLLAAGEITNLKVHPRYLLQAGFKYKGKVERPIYYEGDFAYLEATTGALVVEDVKGKPTQAYRLKRKLFLAQYRDIYDFREVEAA